MSTSEFVQWENAFETHGRDLAAARTTLPFPDTRDIEEQGKELIAPMKKMEITADVSNAAWDVERFNSFIPQDDFDSIHPSLFVKQI